MLSNHPSVLGSGGGTAYNIIGGTGLFDDGTAAAPSISFAADTDLGVYRISTNVLGFACGGVGSWQMYNSGGTNYLQSSGTNGLYTKPAGEVGLYAGGTNQNITLLPSGTGGVMIGGGTFFPYTTGALALNINATSSAQSEIKLTNSTTGNSATAGLLLTCNGNDAYIWNGQATGALYFGTANATRALFLANGRFLIGTSSDSGALLQLGGAGTTSAATNGIQFGTDVGVWRSGAYSLTLGSFGGGTPHFLLNANGTDVLDLFSLSSDIYFDQRVAGKSIFFRTNGATLALTLDASQHATFAGNVTAGASSQFGWTGKSSITTPSDGVIKISNASGTDFNRLQFGGTTASFPALKRTGPEIDVLLANESDFAAVRLASVRAVRVASTASAGEVSYGGTTATTVGAAGGASLLPATPLGYIIVNVAGTAAKIPYYNS